MRNMVRHDGRDIRYNHCGPVDKLPALSQRLDDARLGGHILKGIKAAMHARPDRAVQTRS